MSKTLARIAIRKTARELTAADVRSISGGFDEGQDEYNSCTRPSFDSTECAYEVNGVAVTRIDDKIGG